MTSTAPTQAPPAPAPFPSPVAQQPAYPQASSTMPMAPPQQAVQAPPQQVFQGPQQQVVQAPQQQVVQGPPQQAVQGPPQQVVQAPPQRQVVQAPPQQVFQGPQQQVVQAPPQQVFQGPPQQAVQAPPQQVFQGPPQMVAQTPPQMVAQAPPQMVAQAPPPYIITQADNYLAQGLFAADIADFASYANLATGFPTVDDIQPFYPGLYCLGAISSIGKTTFALQLADQFAASGHQVIYFTLEQTRFELVSKSLARGFFQKERYMTFTNNRPSGLPRPSSMDIRRGIATAAYPQELQGQVDRYITKVGDRMHIVHGAFSLTVEDIMMVTEDVIRRTNSKPLVIVDYLQIVAPTPINGRTPDSKTAIDHTVHALKVLQGQHNLVVLAISSLNRQSYLMPVDFESFKESGGIEYTADVIWGLQLSVMTSDEFCYHRDQNTGKCLGPTSLQEKRDMVNNAKASSPRKIDLVCLKNRYGCANYEVKLEYFPANDFVWSTYDPNDPRSLPQY